MVLPIAGPHRNCRDWAGRLADATLNARLGHERDLPVRDRQAIGRADTNAIAAQRAQARVDVWEFLARHDNGSRIGDFRLRI